MKVLVVTGGRDYIDRDGLILACIAHGYTKLGFTDLYVGDAKGVDREARIAADTLRMPIRIFEADWDQHGLAAGPRRNVQMLLAAVDDAGAFENVLLIAFPGGKGTANCVHEAKKRNIPVWEPFK